MSGHKERSIVKVGQGRPRVALVSTPWPLFNRPSIQLAGLKSYAIREIPHLHVDCLHLYLSVAEALGYELYREISQGTWLAECCYAALLYPERSASAHRLWKNQIKRSSLSGKTDFQGICRTLKAASDRILRGIDWGTYGLAGFSICFGQLLSTLYFIGRIKKRAPHLKVVVGGSACGGSMGASLLRAFPGIDFVVTGEGELPFAHLLRRLTPSGLAGPVDPVPGLLSRRQAPALNGSTPSQVSDLDRLPVPDYRDYFDQVQSLGAEKRFLPEIPMEMSRGCWWRGFSPARRNKPCAFCNLNLQWEGYRTKSRSRVLGELRTLVERHRLLSISFTDNLLPPGNLGELFDAVRGLGKDLHLFAEIRATTRLKELTAMKAAGVAEVQVGVEALSTGLLRKLRKGTTCLRNLEVMKHCEAQGTPILRGNLILRFPGSDEQDVAETMRSLEFALPFRPLDEVSFWLGRGSPVFLHPEHYGIRKIFNHPFHAHLFPPEILGRLELLILGYRGDTLRQKKLWQPVARALRQWKASYAALHSTGKSEPLLSYADGGDFLIVRQRGETGVMSHRLEGASREIYLFCEETRSLSGILGRFPRFGEEKLLPFLRMMEDRRLMFTEGDRHLSLAVPTRGYAK